MKAKWVLSAGVWLLALILVPILAVGGLVGLVVFSSVMEEHSFDMVSACASVDGEPASLSQGQVVVVTAIADVANELNLGPEAMIIALTTALAESQAKNLANDGTFPYSPAKHSRMMSPGAWRDAAAIVRTSLLLPNDGVGRDWDSLGPFQQRPSAGWGTVAELMDPVYAARAFFGGPTGPNKGSPRGLLDIPNWQSMGIAQAAQSVQISAFPDAYNRYIERAKSILATIDTSLCEPLPPAGTVTAQGWTHPVPAATRMSSRFGEHRGSYVHAGDDFPAPTGTPLYAAADGVVVDAHCRYALGRSPCQIRLNHGGGVETLYVHMYPDGVHVSRGQTVKAGQHIGGVGSNGRSTGPHLHLEVWVNGTPVNPVTFFAKQGVRLIPGQ